MFKRFRFLIAFVLLLLTASMACSLFSGGEAPATEAPPPVQVQQEQPTAQQPPTKQPPTPLPVETEAPEQVDTSDTEGGFVTFTDPNDLYYIDVPADWTYEHFYDEENNYYYIDTFTSPDGGAVIENIVYDDGEKFTGNQKSKFALYLLNTFYSSTGQEGDIKVTDYKGMSDGSERLTWTSRAGGYSGISFLETRSNGTTFLFFTVDWGNDVEDVYFDTLNYVIESYTIP